MKTIDLTVMLFDTPQARIYISLLEKNGYRPSKILLLNKAENGKKYKLIRRFFGEKFAVKILSIYKRLRQKKQAFSELDTFFLETNGLALKDINGCLDSYPKESFSTLSVIDLADKNLVDYISKKVKGAVLFTGGGILKKEILSIPSVKFIHIHPGIVPDIRGADCFFWSYLLNGKAGYSVFYMNEGIDTGDILHKREFEVNLSKAKLDSYENQEVYLSILKYHDPCLRVKTFIELLDNQFTKSKGSGTTIHLMNLPFIKQDANEGRMYFFMHKALLDFVISKLKKDIK